MKLDLTAQKWLAPVVSSRRLTSSAEERPNIIRRVRDLRDQLQEPMVCLTFDDGPDPLYTPMILDILREQKISASFFVTGQAALHLPRIAGRIADEGHSIGNHTYSHCHPWLSSQQHVRREVSRATAIIAQIAGHSPRWFRPPFGRLRRAMVERAKLENMATVLWSHSIIDWGWCATEAGIQRRLNNIKAGDIVLMHDGKGRYNRPEILVRQLPAILERLKQQLVLVTLDQISP